MSATEPLVRVELPSASIVSADVEAQQVPQTLGWPITRLAAWSLSFLLWLSILGPATAGRGQGSWLVLLGPAIGTAIGTRALFKALAAAPSFPGAPGGAFAVLTAALAAAGLMAGMATIVGTRWSPLIGGSTAGLVLLTLSIASALRTVEVRFRLGLRHVYFVGSGDAKLELERELAQRLDARLVGATLLGRSDSIDETALHGVVLAANASVLVLDSHAMQVPELVDAASRLGRAGLRVWDLVSYYEHKFKKVSLGELAPSGFLLGAAIDDRRHLQDALRRAFEIALAAALLLLALLPLLVMGILIRLTSPGPALYRQRRVGKDGKPFTLVKLRTMSQSIDEEAAWAPSQAHRVTPIGRHLRRFRLDELPQLWSVIRGDLALIGPRPEQVPIVERLEREVPYYSARHSIRPGITGWAQVNLGYGGSDEGTLAKLQRDLYYVKRNSLRLNGLIVWLTLKTVLEGRE